MIAFPAGVKVWIVARCSISWKGSTGCVALTEEATKPFTVKVVRHDARRGGYDIVVDCLKAALLHK